MTSITAALPATRIPTSQPHLVWLHTVISPRPSTRCMVCWWKESSPSVLKSFITVSTSFDQSDTMPSVQERPSSPQGAASACCAKIWSSGSSSESMVGYVMLRLLLLLLGW